MTVAIIGIIFIGGLLVGPIMSNVESSSYEVVATEQDIEIRRYQPMIIAEVEMEGAREDAIGEGFSLLADYIFGNNTVQQGIAMTAPVQQQGGNQKISMTAPVQQQSTGRSWKVSFVMPSEYTMESLPKPNNDRVVIKEIPDKKFAVIRFSGTGSDKNMKEHEKQLMEYIEVNEMNGSGLPKYAFYNPPWTLPLMRRNEVMIEIDEKQ